MIAEPGDDLELEKSADYRTFTLSGSHYEMGRQWGMIALGQETEHVKAEEAAELAQLLGVSVEQLATLSLDDEPARQELGEEETLSPSQLSFGQDCLQVVCNFHPPLMDEFEGWADALGTSMDSVLSMLSSGLEGGSRSSSSFAWRSEASVIVGRNHDSLYLARTRHLIHARPEIYYATVGMNDGLLGGRQEGVNERGLFVSVHRVVGKPAAKVRPGVISHLLPRILLETCATAGEAVMLAREIPHLMSFAYLIADQQGMFVVEAHPESVRVREAEDGYIAVTNHYLHPDFQSLMQSTIQENSEQRHSRIVSALEEADEDSDPWETAKAILCDHETPICGHTDGLATLWSMVADLPSQRLAYSLGAPCRNEYQEIPWPGTTLDVPQVNEG